MSETARLQIIAVSLKRNATLHTSRYQIAFRCDTLAVGEVSWKSEHEVQKAWFRSSETFLFPEKEHLA